MIRMFARGALCWMVVGRESAIMVWCGISMLITETINGVFELVFDLTLKPLRQMVFRRFPYLSTRGIIKGIFELVFDLTLKPLRRMISRLVAKCTTDLVVLTAVWIIDSIAQLAPSHFQAEACEY